jgi:hypothetical protein
VSGVASRGAGVTTERAWVLKVRRAEKRKSVGYLMVWRV